MLRTERQTMPELATGWRATPSPFAPRPPMPQPKPAYIVPGSSWENGYCESFNSKICTDLLDGEIF